MRIAITAIDLEQAEHRGIAYLSKGLISSLSDLGAEVYLLTGFYGRRLNPLMKLSRKKVWIGIGLKINILNFFLHQEANKEL